MRIILWLAIGAVIACITGIYFITGWWLLLIAAGCLVVAVPLRFLKVKLCRLFSIALLGCAIGLVWFWGFDHFYLSTARQYDGKMVETKVEVIDYSYATDYGYGTDGRIQLGNRKYRIRFYSDGESYAPGDVVEGKFSLRFTASGGEQAATYHQGKSIFLLANCNEPLQVEKCEKLPMRHWIAGMRRGICNAIDEAFPEDTEGFARALLLGDSSKLSRQEDEAYADSGIRHVIAVSGLHVSILCTMLYIATAEEKVSTLLFGIPMLILFAALAGFTPSVMRAVVMQGLLMIGLSLDKEYDPPTALGFSVLIMLAVNPLVITSVSFQLSAGCTIGILLFSGRIHHYLLKHTPLGPAKGKSRKAKMTRRFVSSVSISLSAVIVTTPLCALYFGKISLVGLITNLLALWVVSFIFCGIMTAGLLAVIWKPLGQIAGWIISWPIRYVQLVAKLLSKIPYAAVYTSDIYVVVWLIFAYILLFTLLHNKNKRPFLTLGCIGFGLIVCLVFSGLEQKDTRYSVMALDVGQGQSILLQSGDQAYLVDCGGDSGGMVADTVKQAMRSERIDKLDGVILTHYDADHTNGLLPLLEEIEVECLYLPDVPSETDIKERILNRWGHKAIMVDSDLVLEIPDGKLTIFGPEILSTGNNNSLCILYQVSDCDILITGDRTIAGEIALLEHAQLPKLEILIVGHHGSETSTSMELLEALQPEDVVISVGKDNRFGHPAKAALLRLWMYDCRVWRTDLNGTIRFEG